MYPIGSNWFCYAYARGLKCPLILENKFGIFLDFMWTCLFLISDFVVFIFETIIQDIELSKEINESFKQSSQARKKLPTGIEMSVHVLTTG